MFGLKTLRIRKIERSREKEEKQRQEEQRKIEEERREKEREAELKKTKEKIPKSLLTISAPAYVDGIGKKLSDYEIRGVDGVGEHYSNGALGLESAAFEAQKDMLSKMEKLGAEIIVDIKPAFGYDGGYKFLYMMGTALIPKKCV